MAAVVAEALGSQPGIVPEVDWFGSAFFLCQSEVTAATALLAWFSAFAALPFWPTAAHGFEIAFA